MNIKAPYLLFLGDAKDELSIKIAKGIAHWRPEVCVGELKLPDCTVSAGFPELDLTTAIKRGAKTLVLGLANSGGFIDNRWVPTIVKAIEMGFDIASGLHQRLINNEEIAKAAQQHGTSLIDVRHSDVKLKTGSGEKRTGKRLLTVGSDCSIGKMYTTLAIHREMQEQELKSRFVATGQSGIFISGEGLAIDCVISDFISGAVEHLSPANDSDHWDIIEGQGSLFHPAFAGVSLGLIHGAQPDALVLCHEPNRQHMRGLPNRELPKLTDVFEQNIQSAKLTNRNCRWVGIALNTSKFEQEQSKELIAQFEDKFQLPCTDPFRFGVTRIVDFIESI